MKNLFLQLLVTAALTLTAMGVIARAQEADQDAAPATPHQPTAATPRNQDDAQMPASGDFTTHETKTFRGEVAKEGGNLVLKDLVTKVSYKLNDSSKAKQYLGKQVKVSGKLDMSTNTIHVEKIQPTL
jgi:hypothetical protein